MEIIKYPRTRHIEGSRIQSGDEDLNNVRFEKVSGMYLVLEEKVDGANTGISFDESGSLYLQSRGHFLNGGYGEKQFALFKTWANCHKVKLYELLGSRYIMYGEWLYAKHTVYYDALSHYFMEFDIYDKKERKFLSTKARRALLDAYKFIVSVLVLYTGHVSSREEMVSYLTESHFKSKNWREELEHDCRELGMDYDTVKIQTDTSDQMEGIYIKVETEDEVIDRYKYVRGTFLNTILDSETHWMNRPLIPNKLKPGVDLYSERCGG